MPDAYTDTTALAALVASAYDKYLRFNYRNHPVLRQFVDVHPVDPTHRSNVYTLNKMNQFAALATAALAETSDVTAVAPPAPDTVTITLAERGNAEVTTLKLREVSYTSVDPAVARLLADNMIDSVEKLVQNVLDTATNEIGKNATVLKSNDSAAAFSAAAVAAGDKMDSSIIRAAVTRLRRRNAPGWDASGNYVAITHPDVLNEILSDSGWLAPHQYVDPSGIYNAEVGTYLGARFIASNKPTITTNVLTVDVYDTYFIGREGLAEAVQIEPHIVVGPVVDRLRRFQPMGWHGLLGHAIFRQECLEIAKTSATLADV